jgi:hypothetical protein
MIGYYLLPLLFLLLGGDTSAQDMIILNNGDEVSAKITEVGTNEVKYKRVDNLDGPAYVIPKADIFKIKYKKGTSDLMSATTSAPPAKVVTTADAINGNIKQCNCADDLMVRQFSAKAEASMESTSCYSCAILAKYRCAASYCENLSQKQMLETKILAIADVIMSGEGMACCPELLGTPVEWCQRNCHNQKENLSSTSSPTQNVSATAPSYGASTASNHQLNAYESAILDEQLEQEELEFGNALLGVTQDIITNVTGSANPYLSHAGSVMQGDFSGLTNSIAGAISGGGTSGTAGLLGADGSYGLTGGLDALRNFETAQAIGLGVDMANALINALAEEKEQYRREYRELAKLSNDLAGKEIDGKLQRALMGSFIGVEPYNMLNPLYRYDFRNGASLRVEGVMLKLFTALGTVKTLIPVEFPHNSSHYDLQAFDNKAFQYRMNAVLISEKEDKFYIYTGKKAINNHQQGLLDFSTGYVLHTLNGDEIATWSKLLSPSITTVTNSYMEEDRMVSDMCNTCYINFPHYRYFYNFSEKKSLTYDGLYKHNSKVRYVVNNRTARGTNWNVNREFECSPSISPSNRAFWKSDVGICFTWACEYSYTDGNTKGSFVPLYDNGSKLQIATRNEVINQDFMLNEIAGFTFNKNEDLYFVNWNGQLAMLRKGTYNLQSPSFTQELRSAYGPSQVAHYDGTSGRSISSVHGALVLERNSVKPLLNLSPDENWLVYVVHNNLHIISRDLSAVKTYTLAFEPGIMHWAREQGVTTLLIQGLNGYCFPITKKYNFDMLVKG